MPVERQSAESHPRSSGERGAKRGPKRRRSNLPIGLAVNCYLFAQSALVVLRFNTPIWRHFFAFFCPPVRFSPVRDGRQFADVSLWPAVTVSSLFAATRLQPLLLPPVCCPSDNTLETVSIDWHANYFRPSLQLAGGNCLMTACGRAFPTPNGPLTCRP